MTNNKLAKSFAPDIPVGTRWCASTQRDGVPAGWTRSTASLPWNPAKREQNSRFALHNGLEHILESELHAAPFISTKNTSEVDICQIRGRLRHHQ